MDDGEAARILMAIGPLPDNWDRGARSSQLRWIEAAMRKHDLCDFNAFSWDPVVIEFHQWLAWQGKAERYDFKEL